MLRIPKCVACSVDGAGASLTVKSGCCIWCNFCAIIFIYLFSKKGGRKLIFSSYKTKQFVILIKNMLK